MSETSLAPGAGWTPADFERIYAHHAADIYAYVARRVGTSHAEDLTAQAFSEAWRHQERFDHTQGSERGWLFGIAANLIRRHLRTEQSRLRAIARLGDHAIVVGEDDDVVRRLDAGPRSEALVLAFGRLDEVDQEIISLAGFTDLSMEEIAAIVEMPVGTVKSRLSRARGRLRGELAPDVKGVTARD